MPIEMSKMGNDHMSVVEPGPYWVYIDYGSGGQRRRLNFVPGLNKIQIMDCKIGDEEDQFEVNENCEHDESFKREDERRSYGNTNNNLSYATYIIKCNKYQKPENISDFHNHVNIIVTSEKGNVVVQKSLPEFQNTHIELPNERDDAIFALYIEYQNEKSKICDVEAMSIQQYPKENVTTFPFTNLSQDYETGHIEFGFTRLEIEENTSQELRVSGDNQTGTRVTDESKRSNNNLNSNNQSGPNTQDEIQESQTTKPRPGTATNKGQKIYQSQNENLAQSQKVPDEIEESQKDQKVNDEFNDDFEVSKSKEIRSIPNSKEDYELEISLKGIQEVVRLKVVFLKIESEVPLEFVITNSDNTDRELNWGNHKVTKDNHTVTVKNSSAIFSGPLENSDESNVYVRFYVEI